MHRHPGLDPGSSFFDKISHEVYRFLILTLREVCMKNTGPRVCAWGDEVATLSIYLNITRNEHVN